MEDAARHSQSSQDEDDEDNVDGEALSDEYRNYTPNF
jgi:hypothetical protein